IRSAQRAMKKLHLHAYHVRCVQELKDLDKEKCLVYCRWFQTFVGNHGIEEFDQVFFTDEAWFHLSGYVNSQNNRIWSSENPNVLHEKPLHCQKIGVWCAVSRRRIVGSIFFSPDLSPADFFLWGYFKGIVYKNNPHTLDDLKRNITMAINSISLQVLHNVASNMVKSACACIAEEGSHFEHML
ncbi:hypothetical protein B7P43_G17545, partial [Cryptotermes secundus]